MSWNSCTSKVHWCYNNLFFTAHFCSHINNFLRFSTAALAISHPRRHRKRSHIFRYDEQWRLHHPSSNVTWSLQSEKAQSFTRRSNRCERSDEMISLLLRTGIVREGLQHNPASWPVPYCSSKQTALPSRGCTKMNISHDLLSFLESHYTIFHVTSSSSLLSLFLLFSLCFDTSRPKLIDTGINHARNFPS